jgi:hypothetical protein
VEKIVPVNILLEKRREETAVVSDRTRGCFGKLTQLKEASYAITRAEKYLKNFTI